MKMSELDMEIRELIEQKKHPVTIAKLLGIPLGMVYDVLENWYETNNTEVFSPYETINS